MNSVLEEPAWLGGTLSAVFDPEQESERIESLRSLNLLDTPAEDRFDRITQLASSCFNVPIAYVALIDGERQWYKSSQGICGAETPRHASFCQYTIHRNEPLVILDTHKHPMAQNHPLVVGEPFARFYAGVPLAGPNGRKIGTFCIVDIKPHEFTVEQVATLKGFAALVEREINLGEVIHLQNDLLRAREELVETQSKLNEELSEATKYVRMLLPPPIDGDEEKLDWQFFPSTALGGDGLGYRRVSDDLLAIYVLDVTGHGLGSALLAVTALELLRNPAAQIDFTSPAVVIERLNRTFQMKDHGGKFFSSWYGVYSRSKRTITYANAGHPPALLATYKEGQRSLARTAPGASVLGILPEINAAEMTLAFPAGSELYLFTDGLYEKMDPKGGRGSYNEFAAYLAQAEPDESIWNAMLRWLEDCRLEESLDDDVSLLRFTTRA